MVVKLSVGGKLGKVMWVVPGYPVVDVLEGSLVERQRIPDEDGNDFTVPEYRWAATLGPLGLRHDVIARLLVAWTQLLGAVSFAVWGHVQGFASDPDAFFEYATESMGRYVGLEH